MKLNGGLDMYGRYYGDRYISDETPYGRKVRYMDENGYDSDTIYARTYFDKGAILTVKEIYVGRSTSDVEFLEFPNKKFNTVMFEDVEE